MVIKSRSTPSVGAIDRCGIDNLFGGLWGLVGLPRMVRAVVPN